MHIRVANRFVVDLPEASIRETRKISSETQPKVCLRIGCTAVIMIRLTVVQKLARLQIYCVRPCVVLDFESNASGRLLVVCRICLASWLTAPLRRTTRQCMGDALCDEL